MTPTLLRCWGLTRAALMGLVVAGAALLLSDNALALPYIRLPIPVPTLLPPLLACLLTWPLVERWRPVQQWSARSPILVPLVRLTATLAICTATACLGCLTTTGLGSVVAITAIGTGVAAACTALVGARAPVLMLLLAYAWLNYLGSQPVNLVTEHPTSIAPAAMLVGGGLYVWRESVSRHGFERL